MRRFASRRKSSKRSARYLNLLESLLLEKHLLTLLLQALEFDLLLELLQLLQLALGVRVRVILHKQDANGEWAAATDSRSRY